MANTLNGNLTVGLSFLNQLTTGTTGANPVDNLLLGSSSIALANGTSGDNLVNQLYYVTASLAATTVTYDLTALAGTFGTVTFAKVKALYIINNSTTDGVTLSVGNAGSNPWSAPFSASTTVEKVMASSPMLKTNLLTQGSNPWTVDATHKNLMLDSGASTISYTLAIVGV